MQKILYILRHAKTEAAAAQQDDHERALTKRGLADAQAMGEYLRQQGIRPDRVVCSTAMRTRQTWEQLFSPPLEGGAGGGVGATYSDYAVLPPPTPRLRGGRLITFPLKGGGDQVEYTDKLYLATVQQLLDVISQTPESAHSLMLIGHNPGLHQLAMQLAKEGGEALINAMALQFPTCAFAAIALDTPWRNAAQAHGVLKAFITPSEVATTTDGVS